VVSVSMKRFLSLIHGGRAEVISLAAAVTLVVSESAAAQTTDAAEAEAAAVELETMTVTARRAEEAAKEVPFSLNIISGENIEVRRLQSIEEVLRQTPGVEVNSYGDTANTTVRIRGVGAINKVSLDDSSVVIYIDGVPQSISSATLRTLDVERVEVLKGPQGTLYGRNSEAGAINIVGRRPADYFEAQVRGEIGTESQRLLEGVVSGPLADTLGARLAARYSTADNPITNERDNDPLSEPEDLAVRGTLVWQPLAQTDVTLIANYEDLSDYTGETVLRPYGNKPTVDRPPGSIDDDKTITRLSAEIQHALNFGLLTSITGYSDSDYRTRGGFYEGRLWEQIIGLRPDSNREIRGDEKLFNQEFRLSSRPDDAVFWVAGVNYFQTDRSFDTRNAFDEFNPFSPFNADIDRDFDVTSFAVFGEITYPILANVRLTGGLRYTWDDKDYKASWRANPSNPSPLRFATDRQEVEDDYPTGRAALNYDLNEITTLYAVYARGYKSAGFNDFGSNIAQGLPDLPYEEAKVNSYEIGFKAETPDGRFFLNGAAFLNRTEGDHLYVFDVAAFAVTTENFDTKSKGAELELGWSIGAGLSLSGGIAYTDATVDKVPSDSQAGVEEGNQIPDSPKWSATVSLSYERPLPGFLGLSEPLLFGTVTNRYVGSRPADPQNNFNLSSYHKLDLRIGLGIENAEIYFWGDNLLDETYDLYGFFYDSPFPGGEGAQSGSPGRGRTVGIGLSYYF